MKVYVVQEITLDKNDTIEVTVIGVYSTVDKARKAIKKTKGGIIHSKDIVSEYNIITTDIDYTHTHSEKKMSTGDAVYEKALYGLIKKGLMEALVGEDGYFYYELTEKGQKQLDEIEKKIRKNLENDDDNIC
jgi:hypothetical protein